MEVFMFIVKAFFKIMGIISLVYILITIIILILVKLGYIKES